MTAAGLSQIFFWILAYFNDEFQNAGQINTYTRAGNRFSPIAGFNISSL